MSEQKLLPFSAEVKLDYEGRTIEGYAAAFGNVDLVNDILHRGSCSKTIQERGPGKIKFLWQHDTKQPLGRILEMNEDGRGLFFKAVVSDTQTGRDALALLRDGAIDGMSIGYDPVVHDYSKIDGKTIRNLREIKLYEISLVSLAANPEAQVTALKEQAVPEPEPQAEHPSEPDGAPEETKAGRIIAKRNALRIKTIRKLLQELVDDGGLELDDDEEPEAPAKRAAEDKPASKAETPEAGPDAITVAPP
ncbi:MAG: HK97 family phage prohead protease, partial [Parcubacteria group bacterium]